jgi:hypothetical protein
MRQFRQKVLTFVWVPLAGLLLAAPGCSSHAPATPEPTVRLAAASTPADPPAVTAATAPPHPVNQTERQRELNDEANSRLGFIKVQWTKLGWTVSDAWDKAFGTSPAEYARLMESPGADARRVGINGLAATDRGERPPYTIRYAQIGQLDTDFLVRATAIRSLNRSRDRSPAAMALYVKSLDDPNIPVRLEACKALGHMPTDDAVEPLLRIVNHVEEDKDVRIAAADALRHYKTLEVARTLVLTLSDRDFGIAWTAHHSLKLLTGRDLQYDEGAWLTYLTGPEKPFG